MKNQMFKRLLALSSAILLLIALTAGCGKQQSEPAAILADCTVTVQSEGGMPLANVDVSIYTDKNKTELVDFVRTDENGVAKLNMDIPSGSILFLSKVPEGYAVADYYTLTEKDTVLSLKVISDSELAPIKLGGGMFNFTVTDQSGTEYTLSKLLETKKAVVLNFWYTNCVPCKMEFPYLQQAYNEHENDVALLALNPVDDANAVAAFATENGLTMPMIACDPQWADLISGIAYPTTVVIDRFGTIALIHVGSVDNVSTFENLFAHFVADDYTQSTFKNISSFETAEDDSTSTTDASDSTDTTTTTNTTGHSDSTGTTKKTTATGTASNNGTTTQNSGSSAYNGKLVNPDAPIEYGGVLAFDAEVKAGEMVLYHVYRVSGTTLRIADASAYVIYGETTYKPDKNGNVYVPVISDSPNNPIVLKIGNSGKSNKTYAVTFSFPEGSLMNPYKAKAGNIKTKIEADNDQGVYYVCTAAKDGNVTITLKNITKGVECDIRVTVTDSSYIPQQYLLSDTEDGKSLTIEVYEGDEIEINFVALPDENFKYPAATIDSVLSFT